MKVVLVGVAPWDGEYDLPDFSFTNRELHRIKGISGLRAGELIEALESNDRAAFVGVAVVVLGRVGKAVDPDDLWDGLADSIRIDVGDVDAVPLVELSEDGRSLSDVSSGSGS